MERQTAKKVQGSSRGSDVKRQRTRATSVRHPLLALQQSVGNQAVQRLIRSPYIQARLNVSSPGDRFEEEADRVAQTVMRSAEGGQHVSPTISSVTENAGRTTTGGLLEASPTLENRLDNGFGSQLPNDVRSFMQPRFGLDFGHVNVHTDGHAARMNRELGAQAFTYGSDIYYSAGNGPSNLDLTAHELTHVVQQTGSTGLAQNRSSAQRQLIARKAEIDLPGWGSPLLGDDDSDVTFTPTGDFRTFDLQRDLAALATADPLAQIFREQEGLRDKQWAHSAMGERNGYGGTLQIKAGNKGTVEILVKAHFYFDEKNDDTYDTVFGCSWNVEADLQGKLKILGGPYLQINPISPEAPFQLASLSPEQDPEKGEVRISPQFNSFQFTDIPNVSVGGSLEKGNRGVSGGITFGNEQTFPPGVLVRTFSLQLEVIDIPPPPEPEIIIQSVSIRRTRKWEVLFEQPKQFEVSGKREAELLAWYMSLSEDTRILLREGGEKIKVDGYASTTDKATNNRKLARRRTDSVMKILRDFGAKQFDDTAWGEYEAMEEDPKREVEAEKNRKVVIEVVEAPVTIYPSQTGTP